MARTHVGLPARGALQANEFIRWWLTGISMYRPEENSPCERSDDQGRSHIFEILEMGISEFVFLLSRVLGQCEERLMVGPPTHRIEERDAETDEAEVQRDGEADGGDDHHGQENLSDIFNAMFITVTMNQTKSTIW